jgi:hypothetical protein
VALEHEKLRAFLEGDGFYSLSAVHNGRMAWLSAAHPEEMRFRVGVPQTDIYLDPLNSCFRRLDDGPTDTPQSVVSVTVQAFPSHRALIQFDPVTLLRSRVDAFEDGALRRGALRLLRVSVPFWDGTWSYRPSLGLYRDTSNLDVGNLDRYNKYLKVIFRSDVRRRRYATTL